MRKWLLGLAGLLLALAAAIAGSGAGVASPVATFADEDAPAFLSAPAGMLVLEEGCLYIRADEGRRLLVFHEEEVAWNSDSRELTYRGGTYRLGDHVELVGGTMNIRELKGLRLPRGCVPEDPVVVAPSR